MVIHNRYIALLFIFLISSCGPGEKAAQSNTFFSLKEYFQKEADLLKANNTHLDKTIVKDGKQEQKSFAVVDWQKELHPFSDADINKPAWKNSYSSDTIKNENGMQLIYTALEKKLAVRKIEIDLRNDSLTSIKINIEKKNSYYSSLQNLLFEPGKGYSIKGSQKVILADEVNFYVKAIFKN